VLDGSGLSLQLLPELKSSPYSLNCRNMVVWHGMLFVPHLRGLFMIANRGDSGFVVTNCNPGMDSNVSAQTAGFVTGLSCDDKWLYAAVKTVDAVNILICAGREAVGSELKNGPIVWHPIHQALFTCDDLHVSGLWTNPRLFYGYTSDANYLILPRSNVNPRFDANCTYAASGQMWYPRTDAGAPSTPKIYKSVEIESEGLGSATYLDVYYTLDGATKMTKLGRANVSPRHVLQLGGPEGVRGLSIQIWLKLIGPGGTTGPFIRRLTVRGVERPKQMEIIRVSIRCADNLPLRNGRFDRASVGAERYAIVVAPVEEQESEQEGALPREIIARVTMASFSTEATQAIAQDYFVVGTSYWNSGHIFKT